MKRMILVAALVALPASSVFGAVIGGDDFDGGLSYLTFSQTPAAGAFSSAGDGFETYQRGVSASIPYSLLDDTAITYPGDSLGIVDDYKTDAWFGVTDIVNGDNPSGTGQAQWTFDISGYTGIEISIDMGAMGDFEASGDYFNWTYSIDAGSAQPLFTSSIDEAGSYDYILAGGGVFTLDDPLYVNGTMVTNVLSTFAAPVTGSGSTLTLTFDVSTDGGSEAYAFDNIVLTGVPEPGSLALLALGALTLIRRR